MWKLVSEMLLNMIDVICCENPKCRRFGEIVTGIRLQVYYCPVCGTINYARPVDSSLASSQARFEAYLRQALTVESSESMEIVDR